MLKLFSYIFRIYIKLGKSEKSSISIVIATNIIVTINNFVILYYHHHHHSFVIIISIIIIKIFIFNIAIIIYYYDYHYYSLHQSRAQSEVQAIMEQYDKEAQAYDSIMGKDGLQYTKEGFISYLGVRVIADAKNPVYIGLNSPAKSSFVKS